MNMKNLATARSFTVFFLLLLNSRAVAQVKHYHFEQAKDMTWGSRLGLVYQIPVDSVDELVMQHRALSPDADWLQRPMYRIDRTQFDSLLSTSQLAPGYYVMVTAEENKVSYRLRRKAGIAATLIQLHNKDFIQVQDAAGQLIPDAIINISGKNIAYDPGLKAYHIKMKRKGRLTVQKGNDIIFLRSHSGKLHNDAPSREPDNYSNYYNAYPGYNGATVVYKGYLVTHKPNYQPGDTIKYKAYLLDAATNAPINEALHVYVEGPQKTAYIHPALSQGDGVYFSEFVLGDSILPDQKYTLLVKGKESQAVFRQPFKVEDYLLDDTYLRVSTENRGTYQKGDSIHLYAYAYNANGLPLSAATLELYIRSGQVKLKKDNANTFIPDTLLQQRFDVVTDGDTYMSFATDSLPDVAAMELLATIRLKNANNEIRDTTFTLPYNSNRTYLDVTEHNDSIKAGLTGNKKAVNGKGFYKRNGAFADSISYPYTLPLHYSDINYTFFETDDTGGILSRVHYEVANDRIQIREDYFKDTAYFHITNPQKIWMRYAVYEGNKLLYYGHTDKDTSIRQLSKKDRTFTLIASYNWRNRAMSKQAKAYKIKSKMLIGLRKSDLVYPGQKDSLHISLKDLDEKGISNTNVTVLAFNAKFKEDFTARLESSGYIMPGLNNAKRYRRLRDVSGFTDYRSGNLSPKWSALLGLDTNFFYQHIYKDTSDVLLYSFNTEDTGYAQVAVYVKEKGQYVQPDLIYCDSRLAYARVANLSTDPNALRVKETTRNISFRSARAIYHISKLQLKAGTKTNIFINGDSIRYNAPYSTAMQVIKSDRADSLNQYEREGLANTLFYYKNEYDIPFLVRQKERLFVSDRGTTAFVNYFNPYIRKRSNQLYAIGPVDAGDSLLFFQQGNVKTTFVPELNFSYSLRPGMMRMLQETRSAYQRYNYKIPGSSTTPAFNTVYQATVSLDTLRLIVDSAYLKIPAYELYHTLRNKNNPIYPFNEGNVTLIAPGQQRVKSLFFIPEDKDQSPWTYDGLFEKEATFLVQSGNYTLFILWADSSISVTKPLQVKAGGKNIFNLDLEKKKIDYKQIPAAIRPYIYVINNAPKPAFKEGTKRVYGRVMDSQGTILKAAIVRITGTNTGVVTDENGYFTIDVPPDHNLIAEYSGTNSKRIIPNEGVFYNIVLNLKTAAYTNITVWGKKNDKRTYTGNLGTVTSEEIERRPVVNVAAALSGSVPGISVTTGSGQPGSTPDIMLRGQGSANAANLPLIILDGTPYSGTLNSIDPGDIASMQELKDAGSKAVYGARAANGVIMIKTKAGERKNGKGSFLQSQQAQNFIAGFMEDMQSASGVRSDFRDWAIWEPDLWTDKEGKVSFEVTYPGTATAWKTYVLAMNPKGFAASQLSVTKSFKPLGATLSIPRFLRYGDSVEAVGNVVNYTGTPFQLKTKFSSPDNIQTAPLIEVNAGKTEKLLLTAPVNNTVDTGTLTASFTMETANGYQDGEEKTIPVLPVGVIERKGIFTALPGDTSFSSMPGTYGKAYFTGKTTISIEGSLIDVMMQEIENLKAYPHGCTEQITSKLLSIHYEEVLKQLTGRKDFNNTRTKRVIVNKLAAAQNRDGSFGWFANNSGDIRVSNYVLNALLKVNTDGNLDQVLRQGYRFLQDHLADMDTLNRIASLATLSNAGQKAEYAFYIDAIKVDSLDYYNQFALLKIKKAMGMDYKEQLDTLLKKANMNERGLSWGKDSYDWYRNQMATTLLAYQLIENDTAYAAVKKQVVDYLLMKRNKGHYRNTAESGLVLSTLLPSLIKEQKLNPEKGIKTKVHISGSHKEMIDSFPKRIVLNDKAVQLDIHKEGMAPAYISVNYEFFNPDAVEKEGTFIVSSTFKDNGGTVQEVLKQGESLKLIIKVEAIKDAEYVLIDVPLPAGCIPLPKSKTNPYEASRANFKDKTSIYCNTLPEGVHYFEIDVQARFKGAFRLSPASAAMMYFPDEQGNTAVKRIEIR
ncbi:MAG: hypothetical protein EOP54_01870 [Sphingobacteriales bacterium]|nr:MAG: hypothetical protein EOP54_01870 [Sphingobacteriales bacterium]